MKTTEKNTQALVLLGSLPTVRVREASLALRDDLLARIKTLPPVADDATLDVATGVARDAARWLRDVDVARKAVLTPFKDAVAHVNELAEQATAVLTDAHEALRARMDTYVAKREAVRQEAERLRLAEAYKIEVERERAARSAEEARERALAKARTDAGRERAEAQAAERLAKAAAEAAVAHATLNQAVVPVARPEGLSVRQEPRFEVLDADAAYAARPEWFELTPRASTIKAAVRAGTQSVPGMRLWTETTTSLKA